MRRHKKGIALQMTIFDAFYVDVVHKLILALETYTYKAEEHIKHRKLVDNGGH